MEIKNELHPVFPKNLPEPKPSKNSRRNIVLTFLLAAFVVCGMVIFAIIKLGCIADFCSLAIGQNYKDRCCKMAGATEQAQPAKQQNQIQKTGPKDLRYIKAAVFRKDRSICGYIEQQADKGLCYKETDAAKYDPVICEQKEKTVSFINENGDLDYNQDSKDECYEAVAVWRQDSSLCEKIETQDYKDKCYGELGTVTKDATLCGKIESLGERDGCYIEVGGAKGDLAICNKIGDDESYDRADCYRDVAVIKHDLSICDKLPNIYDDLTGYINPQEYCYEVVAKAKLDLSICDKLLPSYRNNCYMEVGIAKEDESICDKMSDSGELKNQCYVTIGSNKKDFYLCGKSSDSFDAALCYKDIGIAKRDLSICDKINSDKVYHFKEECYQGVGIAKRDLSICDKIEFAAMAEGCYYKVGVAMRDPAVCDKMGISGMNSETKNKCYNDIAIAKQDASVCQKIGDANQKKTCEEVTAAMWK